MERQVVQLSAFGACIGRLPRWHLVLGGAAYMEHVRFMHACLRHPGPPKRGLSRQFLHSPQSPLLQPAQTPQRAERSRLPLAPTVISVDSGPDEALVSSGGG